MKIPSLPIMQQ